MDLGCKIAKIAKTHVGLQPTQKPKNPGNWVFAFHNPVRPPQIHRPSRSQMLHRMLHRSIVRLHTEGSTPTKSHIILRAPQIDCLHRHLGPQIPTESHVIPITEGPTDTLKAQHTDEGPVSYVGPNKVTVSTPPRAQKHRLREIT